MTPKLWRRSPRPAEHTQICARDARTGAYTKLIQPLYNVKVIDFPSVSLYPLPVDIRTHPAFESERGIMPMNAIRASAAYNAKLIPANVQADLTAQLSQMQGDYAVSATAAYYLEGVIKGALQALEPGETIESIDYPFYYAFGKKIARIMRRFPGGGMLIKEVDRMKAIWTSRGLSATALTAIRNAMGVSAP